MFPLKDDNPTEIRPIITIVIIVLCVSIYLYQFSLLNTENFAIIDKYGMKPKSLFFYQNFFSIFTPFSSMFLHGSFLHLIGNVINSGSEVSSK